MSDSVPTRLPCPWDSPGKNTGVGCNFLLQCVKMKSEREVPQLCLTLSDPMDCSLPVSSVYGIFQARVLEWGAIAFSEIWPSELIFCFPCLYTPSKWIEFKLFSKVFIFFKIFGFCSFLFLKFICSLRWVMSLFTRDNPCGSDSKASPYNAGDPGSIPGSGRSPGEGSVNPLQYSCLENLTDRGAW